MSTQENVSIPHLVTGLVFVGLAGAWALHEAGVVGAVQVEWLLPLILVAAGAAGLLATVTRGSGRGHGRDRDEERFVTEDDPTA